MKSLNIKLRKICIWIFLIIFLTTCSSTRFIYTLVDEYIENEVNFYFDLDSVDDLIEKINFYFSNVKQIIDYSKNPKLMSKLKKASIERTNNLHRIFNDKSL